VTTTNPLPLTETHTPGDIDGLIDVVRDCCAAQTPIYPIGGATALDYGRTPRQPGIGLALGGLNRVIDYPARDMTITLEPGVTMAGLRETLAAEGQELPIDVPQSGAATIGGVVATALAGPRCYGLGTMRDYVIGISAVDGRGTRFKGGGRVVKNVAGYDFCKLLTGSLGSLGVIVQLTLRLRPIPEKSALVVCDVRDYDEAEKILAALVNSDTTPVAIELLAGSTWQSDPVLGDVPGGAAGRIVVSVSGTAIEVDWMIEQLQREWSLQQATGVRAITEAPAHELWSRIVEFPAADAPLVIAASVRPGGVTSLVEECRRADEACSVVAHAGSGIVLARFVDVPNGDVARLINNTLRPAAISAGGSLVVLSTNLGEQTHQTIWGGRTDATAVMESVRRQFDPQGLLNPGRFFSV
jgi:glycolate oxidase FAD binding subunit